MYKKEYHENNSSNLLNCPNFNDSTKPFSKEFIYEKKLWPNLMHHFDHKSGRTIYGSQFGIEKIFENQFPDSCTNSKFIISIGWPYGFGSRIHMEGVGMAIAMQLGRVYLPHPD
eukprot:gene13804-18515_t